MRKNGVIRLCSVVAFMAIIGFNGLAFADIGFDSSAATQSSGENNYLEFFHQLGTNSNRVVVVGVGSEDNDALSDMTITGVTYNNVAMHLLQNASALVGSGFRMKTDLYYLLENELPSGGSTKVTISTNALVNNLCGAAISLFGVDQTAAASFIETRNGEQTNSNTITTLFDPDIDGRSGIWAVEFIGCGNPGTFIPTTAGAVEREDVLSGSSSYAVSTVAPLEGGGPQEFSWQHSGANRMAHSLCSFVPQGNVGGCTDDIYEQYNDDNYNTTTNIITPGVPQTHNMCPKIDEDYMKFTLNYEANVTVQVQQVISWPNWGLFNASGSIEVPVADRNILNLPCDGVGSGGFEGPLPPGDYYLFFGPDLLVEEGQQYTVLLTVERCPGDCATYQDKLDRIQAILDE